MVTSKARVYLFGANTKGARMNFRVKIKGFRAFQETQWVRVRPVTLLVGENSSGKSSFMAAVRYMLKSMGSGHTASFNQEPFFLGAYDQIAHFRGGGGGRVRSFQLGIEFEHGNPKRPVSKPITVVQEFRSKVGQPVSSKAEISWNHLNVEANLGDEGTVEVSDDTGQAHHIINRHREDREAKFINLSFETLKFVLSMAQYLDSKNSQEAPHLKKTEQLGRLLSELGHDLSGCVKTSSPVRTRPERTYQPIEAMPDTEGSDAPLLLARINANDKEAWARIEEGIGAFGKASGLFNKISVKRLGRSASDPFQIMVKGPGAPANLMDVGYGVSQVLPLLTDLLSSSKPTVFLHQQPEIHLHPTAQAALGTLFGDIAKRHRHTIVVETHSDFILDRLRMDIREKRSITPDDIMILYFERRNLESVIHEIEVDKDGMLIDAPAGYREFFIREQMRSLWD